VVYSFTIPPNYQNDLDFTYSLSGSSFGTSMYLVRNPVDTDFMSDYYYDFSLSSGDSIRIPGCVLSSNTWYLKVLVTPTSTYGYNITAGTLPVTVATPISAGVHTLTLNGNNPLLLVVNVPNPAMANDLLFQNFKINSSSGYGSGFSIAVGNYCPTPEKHGKRFGTNIINIGDQYYSTASATETVYALVYQNSRSISTVSFEVVLTPVTCTVPTGLSICSAVVTYSIDSKIDVKSAEGLVALLTALAGCNPSAINVFCGAIMPKCDDNNFPIPPCSSDCRTIQNGCSGGMDIVCPTTITPGSYCYANGAESLGISIRVMAVLAILAAFI